MELSLHFGYDKRLSLLYLCIYKWTKDFPYTRSGSHFSGLDFLCFIKDVEVRQGEEVKVPGRWKTDHLYKITSFVYLSSGQVKDRDSQTSTSRGWVKESERHGVKGERSRCFTSYSQVFYKNSGKRYKLNTSMNVKYWVSCISICLAISQFLFPFHSVFPSTQYNV